MCSSLPRRKISGEVEARKVVDFQVICISLVTPGVLKPSFAPAADLLPRRAQHEIEDRFAPQDTLSPQEPHHPQVVLFEPKARVRDPANLVRGDEPECPPGSLRFSRARATVEEAVPLRGKDVWVHVPRL